jgi:hypothetical protein
MVCNCCGRRITPANISPEHVYTLPVYDLVQLPDGTRAAVRIATRQRAVCARCVAQIHSAADRRRAARALVWAVV